MTRLKIKFLYVFNQIKSDRTDDSIIQYLIKLDNVVLFLNKETRCAIFFGK